MLKEGKMNILLCRKIFPCAQAPKAVGPFIPRLKDLIITHKFLEPPAERIAKAEIIRGLFNTTWLVTIARKSVPKDVGNNKKDGGFLGRVL